MILARDPNLARQHPADYVDGLEATMKAALVAAKQARGFCAGDVIGIGVDTTGSTPMPVDADGSPLALAKRFAKNPAAMAWLWKDHTGYAEAAEITAAAEKLRPQYLAKCGGTYSLRVVLVARSCTACASAPKVFDAAYTWVEMRRLDARRCSPAPTRPTMLKRGICAAGHKAMFNADWGGYPDAEFLGTLDPRLGRAARDACPTQAYTVADAGGRADRRVGQEARPARGHPRRRRAPSTRTSARVGSGIGPGTLVKIIGTSHLRHDGRARWTRSWPTSPASAASCPSSILPGYYGLEAGQSAVGDIFNWFVNYIQPGGAREGLARGARRAGAAKLAPGESGLLALDWNNGNRTILVDQRLTGLLVGQTLHTTPAEIYRALIEATAFGARTIIERFEEYGVKVERVVNCGGIAAKNPLVMQIYADVTGRPMKISRSAQTCALGRRHRRRGRGGQGRRRLRQLRRRRQRR